MANTFISTDIIVASGTAFTAAVNNDSIFVLEGVTVASENGVGILGTAAGHDVYVAGFVAANGSPFLSGVELDDVNDGGFQRVTVAATGSVYSEQGWGLVLRNGNARVDVQGTVYGGNSGVSTGGGDAEIFVSGKVTGRGEGVEMFGDTNFLLNSGEILGSGPAVLSTGADTRVENTGLISSTNQTGSRDTVWLFGTGSDLVNHGTIIAQADPASAAAGFEEYAVSTFGGANTIINRGTISGWVRMGSGDDIFDGRGGEVIGRVEGGTGNDTYIVSDPAAVLLELSGEGADEVRTGSSYVLGNNFENLTLIGGADIDGGGNGLDNVLDGNLGDNTLIGRDGNDTLSGRGGDDLLDGGAGNDRAFGGEGADHIRGRLGNDVLVGDDGNDRVQGDLGNDRLFGNDGEDLLIGGEGRDELFGGRAMDVFRFRSVAEVGIGAARDVIGDFEQGTDRIDLFQIDADVTQSGDQAFTLIAGAFTGTAGELRAFNGGGNTFVDGDVDGDGVLDFRLELTGVFALNGGDFLL